MICYNKILRNFKIKIVTSYENMSIFRSHMRNLSKIFFAHSSDSLNEKDYPNQNTILDISSLIENFDFVIDKIFNFENLFTHHLKIDHNSTYKFELRYKPEFIPKNINKRIYEIPITHNKDNFLKLMNSHEIRV